MREKYFGRKNRHENCPFAVEKTSSDSIQDFPTTENNFFSVRCVSVQNVENSSTNTAAETLREKL